MGDESELLFVLASADRLKILRELDQGPLRLTQVAHKLSATVQETSRHIERLSESKLIVKDPEGLFRLTPVGRLVLSILPSFKLLHDEKDYFLSHDLSKLPVAFLHRFGELKEYRRINQLDDALARSEDVIKGAKKYVWLMADQLIRQSYPHEHPGSVSFRLILPKTVDANSVERVRGRIGQALQTAFANDIGAALVMNEKNAAVFFPAPDGRMDLTRGFAGEASEFHSWCSDLFEHYWNSSQAI
jgi:predicted transcriptional regulator